jgi:iron complex outermembrane recepter protein
MNMGAATRILFGAAVVATHPAYAQKTDNNAVTAAEDAFGKSVGDQSIGIYSDSNVRGFSPIDAGNVRIEGLYFDLQANVNSRLVSGSSVRVGVSAQGYNFPAPTGVIDYELAKPGGKLLTSVQVTQGPWKGISGEIDLQVPIDGDRLGIAAGVDRMHTGTQYGTIDDSISAAVSLRYAPRKGVEIMPFWSTTRDWSFEALPTIFTGGLTLPKRAPRNVFTGQPWAQYAGVQSNYGIVARADPLGFDVRLGIFRSTYRVDQDVADLMSRTLADGTVGRRRVIFSRGDTGESTSGELRVGRSFIEGTRRHVFTASVRARRQSRSYGGEDTIFFDELGPSRLLASRSDIPDVRARPVPAFGDKSRDKVTQTTLGLSYEGKWLDVGELTLGVQKTRYSKSAVDPAPAPAIPVTRDSPVLFSAAGAVYITPQLAAYAGYTRGLEESPVAPSNAVNFNEAPPAIKTEQKDAGIRWKIGSKVTAVAGVFDVSKPYFNLDATDVFRQLGDVRHRGIEFSVAGKVAPGLNMVLGNLLIDQKLSDGQRPIGATTRKTILSLNYRLPKSPALSFDYYFESTSSRTANATGTLRIPPRAIVNLGMRYRLKVSERPVLIRALLGNITNTFGWNVSESGGFTPNGTRRFSLSVSTDI